MNWFFSLFALILIYFNLNGINSSPLFREVSLKTIRMNNIIISSSTDLYTRPRLSSWYHTKYRTFSTHIHPHRNPLYHNHLHCLVKIFSFSIWCSENILLNQYFDFGMYIKSTPTFYPSGCDIIQHTPSIPAPTHIQYHKLQIFTEKYTICHLFPLYLFDWHGRATCV